MNNYFYDLPLEIINKIYILDNTYKEIYDKVVSVINKFPVFYEDDQDYYLFLKEYNFNFIGNIKEYFSVSKKYSFKRAVFIIIQKMSKPNTLLSNHS